MTASEIKAFSIFDTAVSEQELDLVAEVRTIRLEPEMFRHLMLTAKVQGMNRTEGLRYTIDLGLLAEYN